MAEAVTVFSSVPALTQLLEQAFRILGRLRKAHQRQKQLAEVLNQHDCELSSVKTIIGIIDDEKEVQTANVASELLRLKKVQSKLVSVLNDLDPRPKGAVKQYTHQLLHGSADEEKLRKTMDELCRVKTSLLLHIQVANVGVMRNMEKQLVANTEVIQQIDEFLTEQLGEGKGLKIARVLQGRRPSGDGTVPLTYGDLKALNYKDAVDDTVVEDSDSNPDTLENRAMMERIILRNTSRHQALQINAAVGEDIWEKIDRIVIKDNVAEGQSVQINHANNLETTLKLLDFHTTMVAASGGGTSTTRRHDSFNTP